MQHCGRKRTTRLSEDIAEKFKVLLDLRCTPLATDHLCFGRRRLRGSWRQFLPTKWPSYCFQSLMTGPPVDSPSPGQSSPSQSASTSRQTTTSNNSSSTTTQAGFHQAPGGKRLASNSSITTTPSHQSAFSINMLQPADLRLVLGVKARRRCLDVYQIDLKKANGQTDGELVHVLVTAYKSIRGRLRLWFSVYQLRFCTFKKVMILHTDPLTFSHLLTAETVPEIPPQPHKLRSRRHPIKRP